MKQTLPHPVGELTDWFVSQPDEVQNSVVILGLYHVPGAVPDPMSIVSGNMRDLFSQWASACKAASTGATIGQLLAFRECTTFFCMNTLGSKEHWTHIIEGHRETIAEFTAQGQPETLILPLENIVKSSSFRKRLWARSAESWRKLSSGALADTHLNLWQLQSHA